MAFRIGVLGVWIAANCISTAIAQHSTTTPYQPCLTQSAGDMLNTPRIRALQLVESNLMRPLNLIDPLKTELALEICHIINLIFYHPGDRITGGLIALKSITWRDDQGQNYVRPIAIILKAVGESRLGVAVEIIVNGAAASISNPVNIYSFTIPLPPSEPPTGAQSIERYYWLSRDGFLYEINYSGMMRAARLYLLQQEAQGNAKLHVATSAAFGVRAAQQATLASMVSQQRSLTARQLSDAMISVQRRIDELHIAIQSDIKDEKRTQWLRELQSAASLTGAFFTLARGVDAIGADAEYASSSPAPVFQSNATIAHQQELTSRLSQRSEIERQISAFVHTPEGAFWRGQWLSVGSSNNTAAQPGQIPSEAPIDD